VQLLLFCDAFRMQKFNDVQAELGRNVRAARARGRLTQEALADAAGLERSQVSLIEREAGNPTLSTLCQLAGALGVTVAQLLTEERVARSGGG